MNAVVTFSSPARRQSGQAVTEFAVSATAFMLLMFGVMQMAFAVYNYNAVCGAARQAARYAIVHSPTGPNPASTSQIQQIAINYAPGVLLSASNVTVTWPADQNLPSRIDAQVAISYNYLLQVPFLSGLTLKLTTTSRMLVSQ